MSWVAGVMGLALGLFGLLYIGDQHGAARVQTRFDLFVQEQKDLANRQAERAAAKQLVDEATKKQLEEQHGKAIKSIHARYAVELDRLQHNRASAGSSGLSPANPAVNICADSTNNDRLSVSLSSFETGIVQLFEQCEQQTSTLIFCQAELVRLNQ